MAYTLPPLPYAFDALEPSIDGLAPLLGVAAWLCAFALWWQNRRLGLDFLLDGRRGPVIA